MTDDQLREIARQNALKHFLEYEAALKDAYARLQNPNPGERLRKNSGR